MSLGVHNVSSVSSVRLAECQDSELRPEWDDVRRRFWAKVRVLDSDKPCWMWTGSRTSNGRYGQFAWAARFGRTRPVGAHRTAYELAHGVEIADGLQILHSCDTPLCVNPNHLFLGTHTDNMQDASGKGRLSIPRRRNRSVKPEVIARYLAGGVTQDQLAVEFGVHKMTVHRWCRGHHEPYARIQKGAA
jgi:hypothetical protein